MSLESFQSIDDKKIERLYCSECKLTFQFIEIFKMHNSRIHKALHNKYKTVVCSFCDDQFSSHQSLRFHLTQEHNHFSENLNTYDKSAKVCTICGVKVRYIQDHMNRLHINPLKFPKPKTKCSMCNYEGNPHNVNEHYENIHKTNTIEACPFCAEIFKNVKYHLKNTNCGRDPSEANPKVHCPKCGKVLVNKNGLRKHLKFIHHQVRDQQCQDCGYNTYSAGNLKLHINKMHLGIPLVKVPCPHCDKKVGNLPLHTKTYHMKSFR